jgi:hypothetical protein
MLPAAAIGFEFDAGGPSRSSPITIGRVPIVQMMLFITRTSCDGTLRLLVTIHRRLALLRHVHSVLFSKRTL